MPSKSSNEEVSEIATEYVPGSSGRVRLLVTGAQTKDRLALVEVVARRANDPPLHAHTNEDELVYVVSGEVAFFVDGHRTNCAEGDCVFLPRGAEHSYSVISDEATLLVLIVPAGLEGYYQDLGACVDPEQYVEQLITVSARYGVQITGPGPAVEDRVR